MDRPRGAPRVFILGCRVDAYKQNEALDRIVNLSAGGAPARVVTLGTEMVVFAQQDEGFRDIINGSALSLCDTIGVQLAARLQGVHIAERVTGVDLLDPLCARLAAAAVPIYLLGGRGDTASRAGVALQQRHPALVVAGARDGYFTDDESAQVAAGVAASGARAVFVGLGSPRQEVWLADHLKETGCTVGIGVGGSLDVVAGNVFRAPQIWRNLGLEWLYRLVREPARWRRQLALPYFVWLIARERIVRPPSKGPHPNDG